MPETLFWLLAWSEKSASVLSIGVFNAKDQLSALLDLVAKGEEVTITRHGRPVAKLVSPDFKSDRSRAIAAAKELGEIAKGHTLGDELTIKDLIDGGRRY